VSLFIKVCTEKSFVYIYFTKFIKEVLNCLNKKDLVFWGNKMSDITRIRKLDDLRQAQSKNLKKGDPIVLADEAGDVQTAVFFSEERLGENPVIITLERAHQRGVVRGLYLIKEEGLYYQAHCQPSSTTDRIADDKLFQAAYHGK
jgi:hypothetical protein